ncbi:MAG: glycosyltransferase family 2 protein [Planctomycetes bacterium]|jgi:dolichol-phosphate mannosyltransferase|nr:glycosyltransferase family 2 protein [Planctomycetota bacterium]
MGRETGTLSVVIPVLNEEAVLDELLRRLAGALDAVPGLAWRAVFVDDGSTDRTAEILLSRGEKDPRIGLLRLSRNFGHQPAISAGLAHADADAVVILDADLQDPPEVIPDLVTAWRNGADVVVARRRSRKERGLRRLGFALFHRFFGLLSDFPVAANAGVFGLLDRAAAEELRRLTERNRFLPGLRSWVGFRQAVVQYDREERAEGAPKQTFRRLARYAMDGIFSFSYKPLRLLMGAGIVVSLIGFGTASFFIGKRLLGYEQAFTGFTTLVSLVLFLGGLQLIALGLLGGYLGRIYDEVKARPLYIVKSRHGLAGSDRPPA